MMFLTTPRPNVLDDPVAGDVLDDPEAGKTKATCVEHSKPTQIV